MSGKSRKRKRKTPVIDPPSLEEISLPMAQLPRLESDASGIRDVKSSPDGPVREWSTVDVVDALQKKRIEDHILQLFKSQFASFDSQAEADINCFSVLLYYRT